MKNKGLLVIAFILILLHSCVWRGSKQTADAHGHGPAFLRVQEHQARARLDTLTVADMQGRMLFIKLAAPPPAAERDSLAMLLERKKCSGVLFQSGEWADIVSTSGYLQEMTSIKLLFGMWGDDEKLVAVDDFPAIFQAESLSALTSLKAIRLLARVYGQVLQQAGISLFLVDGLFLASDSEKMQGLQSEKLGVLAEELEAYGVVLLPGLKLGRPAKYIAAQRYAIEQDTEHQLPGFSFQKGKMGEGMNETGFARWIDSIGFRGIRLRDESATGHKIKPVLGGGFDGRIVSAGQLEGFRWQILEGLADTAQNRLLFNKVLRIEQLREWAQQYAPKNRTASRPAFNENQALLRHRLREGAFTLINQTEGYLPLGKTSGRKIAALSVGSDEETPFLRYLQLYTDLDIFPVGINSSAQVLSVLKTHLKQYDDIVIGLHTDAYENKLPGRMALFIEQLAFRQNVSLHVLGGLQALPAIANMQRLAAVSVAYYSDWVAQSVAAQAVFGGLPAPGLLPVSLDFRFRAGAGIGPDSQKIRLGYGIPAQEKLGQLNLQAIDSVIQDGIRKRAMPGVQLLIARNGRVVHRKAYGYHTYKKQRPVSFDDLYDMASVTKVAATTLSLMHLYEQGRFSLDDPLGAYLPQLAGTNKADLKIRDVLTHQARLAGWLPFYFKAYSNHRAKILDKDLFRSGPDREFSVQVAQGLYTTPAFRDTILKEIYESDLKRFKRYKYSDLGFYLMQQLAETLSTKPLDELADSLFYSPMGLDHTLFKPLRKFPAEQIAPTENDNYFRRQQIQGFVQDRGAALLGGVAGHAGLFSNADDQGALMQMLLNKGEYGGTRYLDAQTVESFTTRQYMAVRNRRALGFDKPALRWKDGYTCPQAPESSYGHTGFTGAMIWADPENELVFVFITNRIYPSINNYKFIRMDIRPKIQDIIYQAIENQ